MPTRNLAVNKTVLAKACERRQELDRALDARDQRIEEATAEALAALEARAGAQHALAAATAELGEALRNLLAEAVSAKHAAALLEIETAELRRLSKVRDGAPGNIGDTAQQQQGRGKRTRAPSRRLTYPCRKPKRSANAARPVVNAAICTLPLSVGALLSTGGA